MHGNSHKRWVSACSACARAFRAAASNGFSGGGPVGASNRPVDPREYERATDQVKLPVVLTCPNAMGVGTRMVLVLAIDLTRMYSAMSMSNLNRAALTNIWHPKSCPRLQRWSLLRHQNHLLPMWIPILLSFPGLRRLPQAWFPLELP
jgi:hypothetical protein